MQLNHTKIVLKVLFSEAVGNTKWITMMMIKEVKSSYSAGHQFTTFSMLSGNVIHHVGHKNL